MEVSGQLHASAALFPGKEPPEPTGQETGWPKNRSGRGGEQKFFVAQLYTDWAEMRHKCDPISVCV
jgi:hypothetical protein